SWIRPLSGADLGVVGMGSSWAETGDEGIDAEAPASVDGAFRAAQSSRALGRGHALDEREEQVGDVGGVAGEEAVVDGGTGALDEEPAHPEAGLVVLAGVGGRRDRPPGAHTGHSSGCV